MYSRSQHNIVKQLSSNYKFKEKNLNSLKEEPTGLSSVEEGTHGAGTHTLRKGAGQLMRAFLKRNDGPGSVGVGKTTAGIPATAGRSCQREKASPSDAKRGRKCIDEQSEQEGALAEPN